MPSWSRRRVMALGLAAASCAPTQAGLAPGAEASSLNALARAKGMRFGSAMGSFGRETSPFADPAYREIMVRECGLVVSENEHKWPFLQPRPGEFTFARAEAMMAWARENGLAYRGHTLIWHHPRWLPRWVMEHDYGANPRAEAERLVTTHINTVCAHFGEAIGSWDVINESVDERTGEFRVTPFTTHIGPEVIDLAFHTARAAAPHAQLVYNDYMGWEHWSANHRAGVLRHLEAWLSRGVPIDALGVQSHIGTNNNFAEAAEFNAAQEREWRAFMDEVVGMGLGLLITEFDVHDKGLPSDIAERDAEVAAYARAYLDLMMSYPQLKDVLAWGMVDKYSWLQGRFAREDGLPKRCTPYDSSYQPKPLREAIAAAFASAPAR